MDIILLPYATRAQDYPLWPKTGLQTRLHWSGFLQSSAFICRCCSVSLISRKRKNFILSFFSSDMVTCECSWRFFQSPLSSRKWSSEKKKWSQKGGKKLPNNWEYHRKKKGRENFCSVLITSISDNHRTCLKTQFLTLQLSTNIHVTRYCRCSCFTFQSFNIRNIVKLLNSELYFFLSSLFLHRNHPCTTMPSACLPPISKFSATSTLSQVWERCSILKDDKLLQIHWKISSLKGERSQI